MINVILQFLELDLVNINVSAIFYQNIPNSLRVKFHCFQNLNLDKTSTNPKCFFLFFFVSIVLFVVTDGPVGLVFLNKLETCILKIDK